MFFSKQYNTESVRIARFYFTSSAKVSKKIFSVVKMTSDERKLFQHIMETDNVVRIFVSVKEKLALLRLDQKYSEMINVQSSRYDARTGKVTDRSIH